MENFCHSRILCNACIIATFALFQGCSSYNKNMSLANPTPIHKINESYQTEKSQFDKDSIEAANIAPEIYYNNLREAKADPNNQNKIDAYVRSGINLVKIYCNRWFLNLGETQRNLELMDTNRNVLTQFATTLIGLGKLHSNVTTLWGAGNATVAGFNANINTAFLVSPNTENVEKLTMDALDGRAKVLLTEGTNIYPKTFSDALFQVEDFAGICTYEKIRRLVTQSVAQSKPDVNEKSGEINIVSIANPATIAQGTTLFPRIEVIQDKIEKMSSGEILQFMKFVPQFKDNADYKQIAKQYQNRFNNSDEARAFANRLIVRTTKKENELVEWEAALKKFGK